MYPRELTHPINSPTLMSWLTLMTVTRNRFSSSSCIEPEMEPIAQQRVFRFFHDHSLPFTCVYHIHYMYNTDLLNLNYPLVASLGGTFTCRVV